MFISDATVTFISAIISASKDTRKSNIGCWTISDRAIMIKIKCKPTDINMIQVYAIKSDSSEEDLEEFYETLGSVMKLYKNH